MADIKTDEAVMEDIKAAEAKRQRAAEHNPCASITLCRRAKPIFAASVCMMSSTPSAHSS